MSSEKKFWQSSGSLGGGDRGDLPRGAAPLPQGEETFQRQRILNVVKETSYIQRNPSPQYEEISQEKLFRPGEDEMI